MPCRKKSFPKVSREEQPLKIVPEAALVPKNTFFIRLEPGFESSDAFLIPGVSLTAHCEIMGKWEPEVRPECDYSNLVRFGCTDFCVAAPESIPWFFGTD